MPARPVADGGSWLGRWRRRRRSRRVEVVEQSMAPSLSPGDRLYVDPLAYTESTPRRGDVVVVRDPEVPSRFLVKRVGALAGEIPPDGGAPVPVGSIWLEGDWSAVSRDSRRFGPVHLSSVLGRAWWRYHPPERRGPIEAGPAIP